MGPGSGVLLAHSCSPELSFWAAGLFHFPSRNLHSPLQVHSPQRKAVLSRHHAVNHRYADLPFPALLQVNCRNTVLPAEDEKPLAEGVKGLQTGLTAEPANTAWPVMPPLQPLTCVTQSLS